MSEEQERRQGAGPEEVERPDPEEPARMEPDERLDTVGLYCPVPIIKTQARMRSMAQGQILEVLSDDRVILVDMPAWCRSTGNEYLGHHEEDGEIHLLVRKRSRIASPVGPIRS